MSKQQETLRIGIAGLGTVGGEVARLIETEDAHLHMRAGKKLVVTAVAARDRTKKRAAALKNVAWVDKPVDLANRNDVDVVVELIGGHEGAARDLAEATLKKRKPLVTANKALLAHYGQALAGLSEAYDAPLYCEAAVAGGIPVIKTLREALAGNTMLEVYGILNGTCNYILSTMRQSGRTFADVLGEAQKLGYAEADPTFDIDGMDAGHKLVILSALAYGAPVNLPGLKADGIRAISANDILFADELGYRIKLLGIARMTPQGLMQRVAPYMVPQNSALAHVDGVMNAIYMQGSAVGPLTLIGRGAGAGPTASAVLSDIIDCARGRQASALAVSSQHVKAVNMLPDEMSESAFYVRLMVMDKPGVLAELAAILRDARISIQSLLQKGRAEAGPVAVVFITHDTNEKAMADALLGLAKMQTVLEPPCLIRILPD
jgi:homoserine dehydrogenase